MLTLNIFFKKKCLDHLITATGGKKKLLCGRWTHPFIRLYSSAVVFSCFLPQYIPFTEMENTDGPTVHNILEHCDN